MVSRKFGNKKYTLFKESNIKGDFGDAIKSCERKGYNYRITGSKGKGWRLWISRG